MGWDALRHWGGDAERIERLTGGSANDVWTVRVRGEIAVGRLGSRSDADLAWEAELLLHLERHGLVVPAPIATEDGRLFAEGLTVMRFIAGRQPSSAADWRRVAETLKQLHALTTDWPQRPGWVSSTDLLTATRGTKLDLSKMPEEAVKRCRAAWARVADRPKAVIHGNPTNPANIMITGDYAALVDWDEAHVDAPELDLALAFNGAGLDPEALDVAQQAQAAWEAAICWEDDYARSQLALVRPA